MRRRTEREMVEGERGNGGKLLGITDQVSLRRNNLENSISQPKEKEIESDIGLEAISIDKE